MLFDLCQIVGGVAQTGCGQAGKHKSTISSRLLDRDANSLLALSVKDISTTRVVIGTDAPYASVISLQDRRSISFSQRSRSPGVPHSRMASFPRSSWSVQRNRANAFSSLGSGGWTTDPLRRPLPLPFHDWQGSLGEGRTGLRPTDLIYFRPNRSKNFG